MLFLAVHIGRSLYILLYESLHALRYLPKRLFLMCKIKLTVNLSVDKQV